jgi:RHS repeat-associated protein
MLMPERSFSSMEYRFGFGGHLKDDEIKGSGNSYDMGARLYDPRIGRTPTIDPLARQYPSTSPYAYVRNNPILRIDPTGKWDIEIHAYSDRSKYGYGIAIVKNRSGDVIARMTVRLEGTAGTDRFVTNANTPTGTYNIDGWADWSGINRTSYGPNHVLKMSPGSGQISETGRSGIHMHGGLQENADGTAVANPTLKKTHGCVRCYDTEISDLKTLTDQLMIDDPLETFGSTTITDDLVQRGGKYYTPDDIKTYENNVINKSSITGGLLNAKSKEDFMNTLNGGIQNHEKAVEEESTTLSPKGIN